MGSRRKFTDEFKREAVRLASRPGNSISSVARELGLNVGVLRRWLMNAKSGRWHIEPGKPLRSESNAEVEQLRRELERVKMERDILKKALAGSMGERNTCFKFSRGRMKSQGLSWALIQT
jgi:transposase